MLLGAGRTLENNVQKDQLYPQGENPVVPTWNVPFILEARPSASRPSSPTAAICCWRINRGAVHSLQSCCLSCPVIYQLRGGPVTDSAAARGQVLPRGKSNNNNKLLISPKVDLYIAAAPPFYKPGIAPLWKQFFSRFDQGRKSRKMAFPLNGFYCVCKHCNCWW